MDGLLAALVASGCCRGCAEQIRGWIEGHAELLAEVLLFLEEAPEIAASPRGERLSGLAMTGTRRMFRGE